MTPAARISAAIEAEIQRSPVPPTTDDLAAAVCKALAAEVTPVSTNRRQTEIRAEILAIAADLRGEVGHG